MMPSKDCKIRLPPSSLELMSNPAVLLLNLGSPDSPAVPDVKRYLHEFLGDERVIDKPDNSLLRSILVHGIIIPFRAKNSAHAYSTIWTEQGSPLVVTSQSTQVNAVTGATASSQAFTQAVKQALVQAAIATTATAAAPAAAA